MPTEFRFGIEHEVAFLNPSGQFADFTNTSFDAFAQIVAELPVYDSDYPQLRIGDAGIKHKRWYIEGFERFGEGEVSLGCTPKGIEIRTTIHPTIAGAVAELCDSFKRLRTAAERFGYTPVALSFNPIQTEFRPAPPLSAYERSLVTEAPELVTDEISLLTYGPDLNLSLDGLSTAATLDLGRKLTAYSPFIVPFSFSSPFYGGKLWDGLSVRTYLRHDVRPAVLVFVGDKAEMIEGKPSLTALARLEAEVGRIEFKACDSCRDFSLYGSLLALLKGLCLDQTLPNRASVPDIALHQHSAKHGFESSTIREMADVVLTAAEQALAADPDRPRLNRLRAMLERPEGGEVYQMREQIKPEGSITAALAALAA